MAGFPQHRNLSRSRYTAINQSPDFVCRFKASKQSAFAGVAKKAAESRLEGGGNIGSGCHAKKSGGFANQRKNFGLNSDSPDRLTERILWKIQSNRTSTRSPIIMRPFSSS
jgi:hypothetical protein